MDCHGSYKLRKLKRAWGVSQAQCQSLVEGLQTGSPEAETGLWERSLKWPECYLGKITLKITVLTDRA